MILYFIRHARQESTLCNVNTDLSPEGIMQAELLSRRIASYPIDVLYTSDLIRAVSTARIVFKNNMNLFEERRVREGLREFDFGALTGKEDAKVKQFYRNYYGRRGKGIQEIEKERGIKKEKESRDRGEYNTEFQVESLRLFQNLEDMAYPDGENGEQVFVRAMKVVEEMLQEKAQHVAAVTHGGTIRALLAGLFGGGARNRLLFGTSLENCSITQIHYDRDKKLFYLDKFNDYAHLEERSDLLRNSFVKSN